MLTKEYWEGVFKEEDPWGHQKSDYETWKFDAASSLLGDERPSRALELACGEGHLTVRLASLVGSLTAVDISPTALARARARCRGLANVDFALLDLVNDALPGEADLIFCSEVLYYFPLEALKVVAGRMAESLNRDGLLISVHGNLISDDPTRTGFDWGHPFGAKTIGEVLQSVEPLHLVRQLRSPLFTAQLFIRPASARGGRRKPELIEAPLPPEVKLEMELERNIIWNGVVITRAEAMEKESTSDLPILMYHIISDECPPELRPYRVTPHRFREQLQYLRRNGYYSVNLDEWANCIRNKTTLPGRPVIITFDDGYQDFFDNAWPELERADFTATVFVVTDKVGGTADWDKHSAPPLPLMGWKELQTLQTAGVTIGSHNSSHEDLMKLPAFATRAAGERARKTLREKLGADVDCIAFPWGRTNERVRAELSSCGYKIAVTTLGGRSCLDDDLMDLPRIEIGGDDDIDDFAAKITSPVQKRSRAKREATAATEDARAIADLGKSILELEEKMPIQPEYARSLAARFDAIVGEFVRLQNQLLNELKAPATLSSKLAAIFAQPVTGRTSRTLTLGQTISPGVRFLYDSADEVIMTIDPKSDHSLSPPSYLNTLKLSLVRPSGWAWLEVELEWGELSAAERFQFSLYAQPSRDLNVSARLRFPEKGGHSHEVTLANVLLQAADRNAIASGEMTLPNFFEMDTSARPKLLILFDINSELSVLFSYLNIYFA